MFRKNERSLMNRHLKEFLVDAFLFTVPAVFISIALLSIHERESIPRSLKSVPQAKNAKQVQFPGVR